MGAALAEGVLRSGLAPQSLTIVEVSESRRVALGEMFPDSRILSGIESCERVVVAVKPPDVAAAVVEAVHHGARSVVSIAAGISLAALSRAAGPGVAVVRAMPNTPSLVGEGAAAYALGADCDADTAALAAEVLGGVGLAVEVDEGQLDAITGLTGSGPAYLFYVAEALVAAGVAEGLDPAMVEQMVRQLFLGAGTLLARSPESPARLREMVTSPGGTTAAGLGALAQHGVPDAFVAAVRAATARSVELGAD
jgi:pyrroline-5-carboxylate reductase